MDPYSAEGELVNIHNAFHQAQYQKVVDFDTSPFSTENHLPARILKLRARIALREYDEVIAEVENEKGDPDSAAVRIFAQYSQDPSDSETAVQEATQLASSDADNLTVQLLCGTVLANAGHHEEALALLSNHQGSLDAVALIIQIHLQQNRTDLAKKEAQQARKWAQDSLLVNLAESWIGLREGGEKYQAAFYVYEELAQAPGTSSVTSLLGQAVSELHLGRLPEAEAALQQAAQIDPQNPEVLANTIVYKTVSGTDTTDEMAKLRDVNPNHQLLLDIAAKKEMFDAACAKYNPKFDT